MDPIGSQQSETSTDVVVEQDLIEDISIDGMCGVY